GEDRTYAALGNRRPQQWPWRQNHEPTSPRCTRTVFDGLGCMGYSLSIKAEEDIINIFRSGMEHFGLYQADRYHQRLERCFQFLADSALAAPERVEIWPAVRVLHVEAHLVVYRVEDDGSVFIIRLRHGHEDWQAFAEMELIG